MGNSLEMIGSNPLGKGYLGLNGKEVVRLQDQLLSSNGDDVEFALTIVDNLDIKKEYYMKDILQILVNSLDHLNARTIKNEIWWDYYWRTIYLTAKIAREMHENRR